MNYPVFPLVLTILLVFFVLLNNVEGARILFASGTPAVSHQKPFQAVWKELSLRGHELHVITPIPLNNKSLVNLTEYDVSDVMTYLSTIMNLSTEQKQQMFKKPSFFTVFTKDWLATHIWTKLHEYILEHKNTRRLLSKNLKFDLVIVEWIFPTFAGLGAYYECPLVGISSLGAPIVALDTLGNPSHPLTAPDMNLPVTRDMALRERLLSFLYAIYVRIYYRLKVLPENDKIVKRLLKRDLPYLGDIEKNVSLLLLNRNPVFHRPIPLLPNIIELGNIKYPKVSQTLDSDLKKWLDDSIQGVIYFSLGSTFNTHLFDPKILKEFQDAFRAVPYKVLWKWNGDSMENQPENVLIRKWIPQTAVLEHPNVKLFIYQGGLQSSEETIAAHKPVIGFPSHSDQTANVDTCVKYGMGKMLDAEEFTSKDLVRDILEVMNDERYVQNVKELDELMSDQPRDGLEKAMYWIEYVIRTNGAKHLRSVSVDLPLWQYYLLDVMGFFVGVLSIVLFLFIIVLMVIWSLFRLIIFRKKKTIKLE